MTSVVVDVSSQVRDLCVCSLCLLHGKAYLTAYCCLQGPIRLSLRRRFDHLPKASKVLAEFCQSYSLDPARCQLHNLNKKVADHETLGQVQPTTAFWVSCCACYVLERLHQAGDSYSRGDEPCNFPALKRRAAASSSLELCSSPLLRSCWTTALPRCGTLELLAIFKQANKLLKPGSELQMSAAPWGSFLTQSQTPEGCSL